MHCLVCNSPDTKVVDSRLANEGLAIRRRRECEGCGYRFSTAEEAEVLGVNIVKRDGRREAYLREKVEAGLRRALEKRPYTPEQFRALVASIERDIQKMRKDELTSQEIGDIAMVHLRGFDKVAYVRFASVYRSFADLETFQNELEKVAIGGRTSN